MVLEQLVRRGIRDPRVLEAMSDGAAPPLRRSGAGRAHAYDDRPLAIGYGQTISQPYMVARATELAAPQPTDRALEVGAGSGYQAAVLAELAAEVFADRDRPRAGRARAARSWRSSATTTSPSIRSTAAAAGRSTRPTTSSSSRRARPASRPCWSTELADGGRLVIPVGGPEEQELAVVRREGDHYVTVV